MDVLKLEEYRSYLEAVAQILDGEMVYDLEDVRAEASEAVSILPSAINFSVDERYSLVRFIWGVHLENKYLSGVGLDAYNWFAEIEECFTLQEARKVNRDYLELRLFALLPDEEIEVLD